MADREDEEGRALHQAVPAPLPPQREVLQVTLPTAQPRVHPQGPSLAPHDSATGLTMHLDLDHETDNSCFLVLGQYSFFLLPKAMGP